MYAIVQVLYENTACFIEALVCARSIRDSGTECDLILLCERNVPEWQRELLARYYTKIVLIDSYPVSDMLFSADSLARFRGVFGKLYAFSMEEYKKILLLDLDTLVVSSIDSLFETPAPAAYFDEHEFSWQHGIKMDPSLIEFRSRNSNPVKAGGYMNIGVCLIEPSLKVFNALDRELVKLAKDQFGGLTRIIHDPHHLSG